MTCLLIAEHNNAGLSSHTARALNAALKVDPEVHILVAGHQVGQVAEAASRLSGVTKIIHVDDKRLQHFGAEAVADLVAGLMQHFGCAIAPATARGRSFLPRVAAKLDVMQVSDVVDVLSPNTFRRPIYAGNAIEVVCSLESHIVMTVRSSAFAAVSQGNAVPIEQLTFTPGSSRAATFVAEDIIPKERPELATADIVVAGGRGLGSQEKFEELITGLADQLGAAVGATRAAVDAGYAPNDWQVGQTGKAVAPSFM